MSTKVFNANDILSGRVVYLAADGHWSERIGDAAIVQSPDDEARLQAIADTAFAERRVVDVYAIEVAIEDGQTRPLVYRERLRAEGPSIRLDLGKQSANG
ncbi:MAG: DUF2849 domain-containing protein [Dongiaceae bacterium]